ncbi:MAG: hypothetical protein PHT88_03930, partial [Candidatus Moranbacteria bacterium]|nr:hypothetical protein [Candidatus Moranbacteria bacterium]
MTMWKKFLYLFGIPFVLFGVVGEARAACDQTLSTGANIASAVSSAAAGSTICLNSGSYGTISLSGINKSSDVTIMSTSGKTATIAFNFGNLNHIKFQNLTITRMENGGGSSNTSIVNNVFTGQLKLVGIGSNVLVDGNTFDGISVGPNDSEGRVQLYDVAGLTLSNNHFGSAGESDGIQAGGHGGMIGPGNVFVGIIQGTYGRHVDSIQLYGEVNGYSIVGNYFSDDTIYLGVYDGGANLVVKNNIFDKDHQGGSTLQLGGINGMLFEHNTFNRTSGGAGTKFANTPNTNWIVQNNIFNAASWTAGGDQPGCGTNCIMRYNLKSNGGSSDPVGTNNITANAIFTGTGSIAAWTNWKLAIGSPGKDAGNDGFDMGVLYYGPGSVTPDTTPPTAPTNLAANVTLGAQVDLTWTASVDAVGVALYQVER